MRITIDVGANELRQIQRITGKKKTSPAIAQALSEFLRQQQRQAFIARVLTGGTGYALTNEQLEAQDLRQVFKSSRHVPFAPEDWAEAAAREREFRASGRTIPRNDLFVATVAIRVEVPVVCRDAHFEAMRKRRGTRLQVEQV